MKRSNWIISVLALVSLIPQPAYSHTGFLYDLYYDFLIVCIIGFAVFIITLVTGYSLYLHFLKEFRAERIDNLKLYFVIFLTALFYSFIHSIIEVQANLRISETYSAITPVKYFSEFAIRFVLLLSCSFHSFLLAAFLTRNMIRTSRSKLSYSPLLFAVFSSFFFIASLFLLRYSDAKLRLINLLLS